MRRLLATLGLAMFIVLAANAQEADSQQPKTKLERFVAQDGAVIVKGFSTIGTLRAKYGGSIIVECKEFSNVALGTKEYGITIEVKEVGRLERSHKSYIDYDEIESLLKGLDYIAKVNKSATPLDNFQADYRTRGDLVLSTFNTDNALAAAISSGVIGKTDAFIELEDLSKLRELVASARVKLDSIKQ